jgi:hypothetical protein
VGAAGWRSCRDINPASSSFFYGTRKRISFQKNCTSLNSTNPPFESSAGLIFTGGAEGVQELFESEEIAA